MKWRICLTFLVLSVFFSFSAQAQKGNAILRAGVNLANVTITNDGRIDDARMLTSFQVGLIGDFHVASVFFIQPGFIFTGKGSKVENGNPDTDLTWYKSTSNPYYIELPLNLVLKTPGAEKFFIGAGPYLAFGVAGKNKVQGESLGIFFKSQENIKFSDDDPTTLNYEEGAGFGIMKRVDYGFNGIAGIECKKFILSANYGFGLAKLQSGANSSSNDFNKHRVLSFILGVKL